MLAFKRHIMKYCVLKRILLVAFVVLDVVALLYVELIVANPANIKKLTLYPYIVCIE